MIVPNESEELDTNAVTNECLSSCGSNDSLHNSVNTDDLLSSSDDDDDIRETSHFPPFPAIRISRSTRENQLDSIRVDFSRKVDKSLRSFKHSDETKTKTCKLVPIQSQKLSYVAYQPTLKWIDHGAIAQQMSNAELRSASPIIKVASSFGSITLTYPQILQSSQLLTYGYDKHGLTISGRCIYSCILNNTEPCKKILVSSGTALVPGHYSLSCLFIPEDAERFLSIESNVASVEVKKGICHVTYSIPSGSLIKGTPLSSEYFVAQATLPRRPAAFCPLRGLRRRERERQLTARAILAVEIEKAILRGERPIDPSASDEDDDDDNNNDNMSADEDGDGHEGEDDDEESALISLGSSKHSLTSGGDVIQGTFFFSHIIGDVLSQGKHVLRVKFEPQERELFSYSYGKATLLVAAPWPTITWSKPVPIYYGTPLCCTQLKAVCQEAPPDGVCKMHSIWHCRKCNPSLAVPTIDISVSALESHEESSAAKEPLVWPGYGTFVYTPRVGTILPVGSHTLSAKFVSHDEEKYSNTEISTTLMVIIATPSITWSAPPVVFEGNGIDRRHLTASTSPLVEGTYVYDPPLGTVLPLGKHMLSVTFTPFDSTSYLTTTEQRECKVLMKKSVVLFWSNPNAIMHPEPLRRAQLCAICSTFGVRGEFTYNPPLETILPAGDNILECCFQTDNPAYSDQKITATITVYPGRPRLIWHQPNSLFEGEILQDLSLNAHCTNVPRGVFIYDPPKNTQLLLGKHKLSCVFEPCEEDRGNWESAQVETVIEVKRRQKRRTKVLWDPPSPIQHPAKLTKEQCNAYCKECSGDFFYFPAIGSVLDVGVHSLKVQFQPSERLKYGPSDCFVKITVTRGTATISWSPRKTVIPYGESITADMLCAQSDAVGQIDYDPPVDTVLYAGRYVLKATITPYNPDNFLPAVAHVDLEVTRHTPLLHWDPLDTVTFPFILSSEHFQPYLVFPSLTELPVDDPRYLEIDKPLYPQLAIEGMKKGKFIFSHQEGQILSAGRHTLCCRYIPDDSINFFSAEAAVPLTVLRGECLVQQWKPESEIIYGLPLEKEKHLNALFDIEEADLSITYDPPEGHIFDSTGEKTLSVTVMPKDKANYHSITVTRTVTVDCQAAPIVWKQPEEIPYGHPLTPTELCAELDTNKLTHGEIQSLTGGVFEYCPAEGAVLDQGERLLTVLFHPPGTCRNFKTSRPLQVILQIKKSIPKINIRPSTGIKYGTLLSSKHINAEVDARLPGSYTYSPDIGTLLPPGKSRIIVNFLPSNSNNVACASVSVWIDVFRAIPELQWTAFDGPRHVPAGYKITKSDCNCVALGISKQPIPGEYFYTPPVGTTLGVAGLRELRCDFVLAADQQKLYTKTPSLFVQVTVKGKK